MYMVYKYCESVWTADHNRYSATPGEYSEFTGIDVNINLESVSLISHNNYVRLNVVLLWRVSELLTTDCNIFFS